MGLDQYAFTTSTTLSQPIDFPWPENAEVFHFWRKHHDLNDWMERLYASKGGAVEDVISGFCIQLEAADIKQLCRDVMGNRLRDSDAYLPGRDFDQEREHDLAFIAKAIMAFARDVTVFYAADW